MYEYRAVVRNVYDGDTITVDLDLGLNIWAFNEKIRLARINAPELRGETKEAGRASRDELRSLVLDKEITLRTLKDKKGKYGRYLGEAFLNDLNVNDEMVSRGFAIYQEY